MADKVSNNHTADTYVLWLKGCSNLAVQYAVLFVCLLLAEPGTVSL